MKELLTGEMLSSVHRLCPALSNQSLQPFLSFLDSYSVGLVLASKTLSLEMRHPISSGHFIALTRTGDHALYLILIFVAPRANMGELEYEPMQSPPCRSSQ